MKEWCIPKAGAEFVAAMEDALDVYQRPYNPLYPVVCLDETSRQLIEETRPSLSVKPGEIKKVDYEYRRNGVVDLFMIFKPIVLYLSKYFSFIKSPSYELFYHRLLTI